MSTQGPFGLKNPFVTCESSFGGYFWLGGDSIFLDCSWVDRGCVRWRIHGSPLETFSVRISERAPTMFFFIVSESTGVACAEEFMRHLRKQFRRIFLRGSDSVFLDCLWGNRGCVGWRIHSSPVKALSRAICEWAAPQFSLTVYESTGAVWADESFITCDSSFGGYFWVVID